MTKDIVGITILLLGALLIYGGFQSESVESSTILFFIFGLVFVVFGLGIIFRDRKAKKIKENQDDVHLTYD